MSLSAVGKTYPPITYAVGREKVREYALAVGDIDPLHCDIEAARAAGYSDVVAPPMFVVVYAAPAMGLALFDPDVGIDVARLVHGGQEFCWGPLVVAGDEVTTTVSVKHDEERGGVRSFVFESVHVDQDDRTVCVGTWTYVVRSA